MKLKTIITITYDFVPESNDSPESITKSEQGFFSDLISENMPDDNPEVKVTTEVVAP
jgi:hypothetical protein